MRLHNVCKTVEDLGEQIVLEPRKPFHIHDHSDVPAALALEVLRRRIGDIIHFFRGKQNLFLRLLPHPVGASERSADR